MSVDSTSAPASSPVRSSAQASLPSLDEMRARQAAEAAKEEMERYRAAVMSGVRDQLRRYGAEAPYQEMDAGYGAAWTSLMALRASGGTVDSEVGWLIRTTFRRVIDWLRLEHWDLREREGVESDGIADLLAQDEGSLEQYVDQQRQLRSLLEAFRHEFQPRETLILFYAYVLELPRREIARRLDMPVKRLSKLLDGYEKRDGHGEGSGEAVRAHGIKEALAQHIDVIASGDWCEKHGSLIRAHALGWFEPGSPKYQAAVEHLRGCPACRRYFQAKRGIAMLLPPVGLPLLDTSHGVGLLDQMVAVGRGIANGARSALGISGPSDAAVATGAGAGGTAIAGTLLGGAGAKVAAICGTLIAGACLVAVGVHSNGDHAATRDAARRPAAQVQAASAPRPASLPVPPTVRRGAGTGNLLAANSLLSADPLRLGGPALYDFVFENQGRAVTTRRHAHRHRAARTSQTSPRESTPAPAVQSEPETSGAAPAPAPAPAASPKPAPASCGDFSFERCSP